MNNKYIYALISLCSIVSCVVASDRLRKSDNPIYFSHLTNQQKSMYNYIAYDLPSKSIRNAIMWGNPIEHKDFLPGSVFRGVCEPNHANANEHICNEIINAFENIERNYSMPTDKIHAHRAKIFNICYIMRNGMNLNNAWINSMEIWEDCHELSGRFGPSDYMAWQQSKSDTK